MAGNVEAQLRQLSFWYNRLTKFFWSHWDERPEVMVKGIRPSGENVVIRSLASRATLFIRVHVQHDGPGGGGETYDANVFVSDTRVDCRADRQQDNTITRDTGYDYFVWLIPEFLEGDVGNDTYTRYDGESVQGVDRMAFVAVGSNSARVEEIVQSLDAISKLLRQILIQQELQTDFPVTDIEDEPA